MFPLTKERKRKMRWNHAASNCIVYASYQVLECGLYTLVLIYTVVLRMYMFKVWYIMQTSVLQLISIFFLVQGVQLSSVSQP